MHFTHVTSIQQTFTCSKSKIETCSKLTPEWRQQRSGVLVVNIKHVSHLFLFLLLILNELLFSCSGGPEAIPGTLLWAIWHQCWHHIETSQLVCLENQLIGFCMMRILRIFINWPAINLNFEDFFSCSNDVETEIDVWETNSKKTSG